MAHSDTCCIGTPDKLEELFRAEVFRLLLEKELQVALSGGLTSLVTRPGSGIVSSGQGVALKLRGRSGAATVLKPYVDLKMAVRPLINLRSDDAPATVMGWYAIADDHFRRA